MPITINDIYKDGSPPSCVMCESCGFCIDCGDCLKFGCGVKEVAQFKRKWNDPVITCPNIPECMYKLNICVPTDNKETE